MNQPFVETVDFSAVTVIYYLTIIRIRACNFYQLAIKIETGVALRLGAGGHLDLAPGQNLCKALKILKVYSCRDAKSSWAKPPSQPVNLPSAQPLM